MNYFPWRLILVFCMELIGLSRKKKSVGRKKLSHTPPPLFFLNVLDPRIAMITEVNVEDMEHMYAYTI